MCLGLRAGVTSNFISFFVKTYLSADEARAVFKDAFMLIGYLHDLPGLIDAIVEHESGKSTREGFQKRVLANLFHNGPALGFWGFLSNVLVPGQLEKSENANTRRVFANTVFENPADASHADTSLIVKPHYPFPASYEGLLHAIADRLSQGTRGGIIKIYWEIVKFTPPLKAIEDLVVNNPKQTIQQIEAIQRYSSDPRVIQIAQIAIDRVRIFQDALLAQERATGIEALDSQMQAVENETGVSMRAMKF